MNLLALLRIVGLRYRLLWANVRSKKGRMILFLVAYFLLLPIVVALAVGGISFGLVAVRAGKAELVADFVLGVAFVNVVAIAMVLGIGTSAAFSDATMRRYPLSALERLVGRQLTALLEPIWIFVLALDLGVLMGFHTLLAASPLWFVVLAAILLVLTNFLLARILSVLVEWIGSRRIGSLALAIPIFLLIALLPSLPVLMHPAFWRAHGFLGKALAGLELTPPFAAARVVIGATTISCLDGLLELLLWCVVLAAGLGFLERLPSVSRSTEGVRAAWKGPCDYVAALFGSSAPLVSKTLRYYLRSNRVRLTYVTSLPVLLALLFHFSRTRPAEGFFVALGLVALVGFSGTVATSVNVFGCDGNGFRRYFLAPISPATVLRVASLVPLCLGALLIPLALLGCGFLLRVPMDDVRMLMLASSGFAGLFFLHGLAIWTSLLTPSRSDFSAIITRDLSWGAKLVGQGSVFATLVFCVVVSHFMALATLLRFWWVLLLMMVVAALFYLFTLRAGAVVLRVRRERILSMVERGY